MAKKAAKKAGKMNVKGIAALVVIVLLAISTLTLALILNAAVKTKTISSTSYSVGSVNTESGVVELTDGSIYTDLITADGLRIEPEEDADVTYQVFFYDEDQAYISCTEILTGDYDRSLTPDGAEYCRVQVTPTADKDGKIMGSEKNEYAGMITITVNR